MSCVTLCKSSSLSVPLFHHLQNGNNNIPTMQGHWAEAQLMYVKFLDSTWDIMHHIYPDPYRHHLFLLFFGSYLCCLCGELPTPLKGSHLLLKVPREVSQGLMIHFLMFSLLLTTLVLTSISALPVGFPPQPLCAATDTRA